MLHQINCELRWKPVFQKIDELLESTKTTILIGIDGKCASGKTILSQRIKELYDCNIFHMDDFFLQEYQRTDLRYKTPGGNVDYERFEKQVLSPVKEGKTAKYQVFNCGTRQLNEQFYEVKAKRLNIIDGSYSQHPYFGKPYDLCVFIDIEKELQLETILKRNGAEMLENFKTRWIPYEELYFETFNIKKNGIVIMQTFA